MRIIYHSDEYGELWVESDKYLYQYEYVPIRVVQKLRKLIDEAAEGKAWQLLRKCKVRRKT